MLASPASLESISFCMIKHLLSALVTNRIVNNDENMH